MTLLSLAVKLTSVSLLRTFDPRIMTRKITPTIVLVLKSSHFVFMVSVGLLLLGVFEELGVLSGMRVVGDIRLVPIMLKKFLIILVDLLFLKFSLIIPIRMPMHYSHNVPNILTVLQLFDYAIPLLFCLLYTDLVLK